MITPMRGWLAQAGAAALLSILSAAMCGAGDEDYIHQGHYSPSQYETWRKSRIAPPGVAPHQRLNPYTGEYETVRKDSTLNYNPVTKERRYGRPGSRLRYSPLEKKWIVAPKGYTTRLNPMTRRYETSSPDSVLKHNVHEDKWKYVEPGDRPEYNLYKDKWEFPR